MATTKAKDPVCGMEVERNKAAAKSQYQGQEYHFCSTSCKQKFDKAPERYAEKVKTTS